MLRIGLVLTALAFGTIFGTQPGHAQNGQWCLVDDQGVTNCGFATQKQCLTSARGLGGMCQENAGNFTNKEPRWRQNRRRDNPDAYPPPGGN